MVELFQVDRQVLKLRWGDFLKKRGLSLADDRGIIDIFYIYISRAGTSGPRLLWWRRIMTIQHFKNLRELNRFLKTAPIDMPESRLKEIRTRAKKKKLSSFTVWVGPTGHVVDLAMDG